MTMPPNRTVSIDLVTFQKPVKKPAPVKPKVIKPKPKPKPVIKPVVRPQPVPEPIVPEPVTTPEPTTDYFEPLEDTQDTKAVDLDPEPVETEEITTNEEDDTATVQASMPLYDLNPPPHYPRLARKRNYQGTVLLEVLVGIDGMPVNIRIARSSGHSILDRSALKAVKKWKFSPALRGQTPFEMWVQVPVRFKLN